MAHNLEAKRLGTYLVGDEKTRITEQQIAVALAHQERITQERQPWRRLGEIMIMLGFASLDAVNGALTRQRRDEEIRQAEKGNVGEILQTTTTVAGLAIALLTFLPLATPAPVVPFLIFISGALALGASISAIVELLDTQGGFSISALIRPTRSVGILFWSLTLLGLAYVLITKPEWGNKIANVLESVSHGLRSR